MKDRNLFFFFFGFFLTVSRTGVVRVFLAGAVFFLARFKANISFYQISLLSGVDSGVSAGDGVGTGVGSGVSSTSGIVI